MKKITLIYSGGSDSFTLLHDALNKGFNVDCITFNYGQKHLKEIEFAKSVCKELNIKQNGFLTHILKTEKHMILKLKI